MFKLIKYLKKSALSIVIIVCLLVIQAVCDLSLPEYTSNIVNVGIQQGGVENSVPSVIRESELNKITLFMDKSSKDKVLDNYTLLNKKDYVKYKDKYPGLKDESLYELNTKDKDTIDDLNVIFGKAILIVSGLEGDSKEVKAMKAQLMSKLPPQATQSGDVDIFKLLSAMPKEQLDTLTKEMSKGFESMPESMITQSSVSYVRSEYEKIGIDTEKTQNNYILFTGAKMLGIAMISMVATITVGFLAARVAASVGRNLRSGVFRKVMSFSNTEMNEFSTASLITRSTNDIQQIQMLMVMLLRIVFYAPIMAIGGVIKVLNTNTSMAWIIAVAVVAILSLIVVLFSVVMPKFKLVQKLVDKLNLVSREIITGIPVIRAFSTEKHEEERFDKANKNLTKTNLFVNRVMTCMMPAMMLIMNLITVLIVWRGAYSVDSGAMQVGDMMAFIQYTMQIIMSFLMISMVSIMLPRASVSATRIDEVLVSDISIKDPEKSEAQEFKEDKKGLVEFKNVSFMYPDAEEPILTNISFTAKPGETTAFIGSTGSGKSTLINLIPRFYDVTEGSIKINGVDIREYDLKALRKKIGFIPQKSLLFTGSIANNIRFGKHKAGESELEYSAKVAQAYEFISKKPRKFDELISEGGANVSGGQKQRLSIARAIIRRPEIYIFDDSFSALDFKTDAILRAKLKKETKDAIVLIVAQRISSIIDADKIIVLNEGQVVGMGTHKELLKNCEIYYEIATSQLKKEELE